MSRLIPLLAFTLLAPTTLCAQDVDPFFAGRQAVWLDPSRAGFHPGARISFIHQDQWLQMPGSWKSELLSVDWSARNTRKQVSSWFGVGLNATHERQGAVGSRMSAAGVVPAMHVRAGQRSFLSAGIELRWVSGLNGEADGAWGSQYDGLHYDASLPSGEQWVLGTSTWAEARAGLSFTLKQDVESPRRRERDVLVVGLAGDHLGQLVLSEGGGPPPAIPMRFAAYALGEVPHEIWDDGFFAAELIVHHQGPFRTGRANIYAGKHLLNRQHEAGTPLPLGFKAGLGYRFQDALLVSAALDLNTATIGLAYGWSMFNPNLLAGGRRTFELMLQMRFGG